MVNKNYKQGRDLEYEVTEIFKKEGWIAQRTAGSHSIFDVMLVKLSPKMEKIVFVAFVQCKTSKRDTA